MPSARAVRDGDTVAMEGFTHLIPFAAAHEVIRAGTPGFDAGADDARSHLRPVDRRRLRRKAGLLVGRESWRRLAAPAARRGRARLAASAGARRVQPRRAGQRVRRGRGATFRFATFRGSPGDLARVNPNYRQRRVSLHRRDAHRRAGDAAGRRDHSRAARRPRGQRAHRRDHRRAEGSRARARRVRSSRSKKSSTRFEGASPNACILPAGRSARSRSFPAARFRRTPTATIRATTPSISRGTTISRDRATFPRLDRRARHAVGARGVCSPGSAGRVT